MLLKKLEIINYLNRRDKRDKFEKSEEKYTSLPALKKAKQLLWKIKSKYLPLLQNASYCYSFVWSSQDNGENKKFYVIDIFDDVTYTRTLENPADIYKLPQFKDKVPFTKVYNNINRNVKEFLKSSAL